MVECETVELDIPENCNVILGYSHFIKTVEDLNEIIKTYIPSAKYAISFSEASGDRLIRFEGNDNDLISFANESLRKIAAGHTFMIVLRGAYPIQVLNQIKSCQEVGRILAATANPLTVLVFKTPRGNGIAGVADGFSPLGVENEDHKNKRKKLLRDIGYKS
ncbi:MAG: adenosine-specific kinase [Candidatus Thermoplasmatota archaeon]|nr:adenosine-specific kinase [Candidatus Thermoplasmatota archaeon]MCL5881777.1 adenosine-specific kinase [Candidatus Thermoplasmatota archaeon]